MSSLLHLASRVQAASEAYISVRDFANKSEWKAKFKGEMKSTIQEFRRVLKGADTPPPLHPILVALTIVLNQDEDLGNINMSHPKRNLHEFYNPRASFPDDISDLLPGRAERWWEHLAEADREANASKNPPPPAQPQHRVTLLLNELLPYPKDEDVTMVVDEKAEDSHGRGRPKVHKEAAAATRKRKGSYVGVPVRAKRHAQSRQRPDSAEKGSGGSNADDPVEEVSGITPTFQCDRCKERGEFCEVQPEGPCTRCKSKKQGCSLMPPNPSTGKTDRRPLSEGEILQFRLKQAGVSHAEVKKGKQRAHDSPDEEDTFVPSPSAFLGSLQTLALDSGSSHVNTPNDSPTILSQPPLPEHPAPAPPPAPKTRAAPRTSRKKSVQNPPAAAPTQHSAGASQLLKPAHRQASRSSGNVSPASDDVRSNEARIAALESRVDELHLAMKKWADEFDSRLSKLGA